MADQKKAATGRELLAAYKKKKQGPSHKERASKTPEKLQRTSGDNDSSPGGSDSSGTTILNEPLNSTHNDGGEIQRLSLRIKELEEIVAGKNAALAAQQQELNISKDMSVDVSSGMLSFGLESDYKACLEKYQQRLVEFESAVNHRDDLIRQLSEGLRLAKLSHEAKEEELVQGIELLQRQLHAATQLVQGHLWDTGINPHDYLVLKNQMLALEDVVDKNKTVINELNTAIQQKDQALQVKADELIAHKTTAAREVQELMREIEDLNQRSQTSINGITLNETLLRAQIEEGFGLQLAQIKDELRNQLALEYSAELSSLKQQVEVLTTTSSGAASVEDKLTTELASYEVELTLHKEQTEHLKKKLVDLSSEMEASKMSHQSELMSYQQQVEALNMRLQDVTALQAQVDSLKRNLSVTKETHIKELEQCRQNHIKEVDMLNVQNETLEMELDNLQTDEGKCAAELNACKEAFIAQFGVSKLANETELITLRQQVNALNVQLKDATAIRDKNTSELDAKRDILETELKEVKEDKVKSLNETIRQLLASQESLVKENGETYKDWLQEKSSAEERHGQVVIQLQKELANSKQQVESVEEKHSMIISTLRKTHEEQILQLNDQLAHISSVSSAEIHLLNEQIENVKNRLEEAVINKDKIAQELDLSIHNHKTAVTSYENKLHELNVQLNELTLKHNETVSSVSAELHATKTSLLEKTRLAEACQKELQLCKNQLVKLNAAHGAELQEGLERYGRDMQQSLETYGRDLLIERDQIDDIYKTELEEIHEQIADLNKSLFKESRFEGFGSETDSTSPSLAPAIKKEIRDLQDLIMHREENFRIVKSQLLETMATLQGTQALLIGKDELEQSLHERELMLNEANESFTAVKQSETALELRVQELEGELGRRLKEYATIKEKLHELLAAQPEVEPRTEAGIRVQELETALLHANNDSQSMQEALQETVVKLLAAQTIVDAKEEVETALQNRISELMASLQEVNEDSQAMRAESDRLISQVAKAKELLKRLKGERDNLVGVNKANEEEIKGLTEKLSLSNSSVNDFRLQVLELEKQLVSKGDDASHSKTDNLEYLTLQITRLQNQQDDLVAKCDRYEEEVRQLQGQLSCSENSLEDLRQELANNKSAHDISSAPLNDVSRRETILASGGQIAISGLSFLGQSFYNENNSSGFLNNMTDYMDVASFKANNGMNLIDNCNLLESERHELELTVESLRDKLKEKELSEELCKQEIVTLISRHTELEVRLAEMTSKLEQVEINIAEKIDLENKVAVLEGELKTLQDIQGNLQNELLNKQVAYEEKLHKIIHEQLSESMLISKSDNIEEVILELGGKAKEVVVLTEKLRAKEQAEASLKTRLEMLDECNVRYSGQLTASKEDALQARSELQKSWQSRRQVQDELSDAESKVVILRLTIEQLEKNRARLLDGYRSTSLVSAKFAVLKEILSQQAVPHSDTSILNASQSNVSVSESLVNTSVSELRNKLEAIFKRDSDHVCSSPKPDDQAGLEAELLFYREQHAMLAEVLNSTGALQEALEVQRKELAQKLEEKAAIESQLCYERDQLGHFQLRLRLLEQQVVQKDSECDELSRQKQGLERELCALEERLREREHVLEEQRALTEKEIRERDLEIRQWQVQCKAKEMELSAEQAFSQLVPPTPSTPNPSTPAADCMDRLRHNMDTAHDRAVSRLKIHLQEVFAVQETETRAEYERRLATLEQQHLLQLANNQQQIQAKIQELDTFHQLGDQREKHETDLEEMKEKLDENQKEIYSVLQQQFDSFACQQISAAIKKLQAQHEIMLMSQTAAHSQELQALQSKLEHQKQKEILSIKQELLQRHEKDLKDIQEESEIELNLIKHTPRSYPTDTKSAVQLLKQFLCNDFSTTFRALTNARYGDQHKQLSALTVQLEAALKQEDPFVMGDVEELVAAQETLVEQTQAMLQTVSLEHSRMLEALGEHLDVGHTQLLNYLEQTAQDVGTAVTAATLRLRVAQLEHDVQQLSNQHRLTLEELTRDRDESVTKLDQLKAVAGVECGPCAFLRQELEAKHTKEVEELRQYFEQKCAEVEKHYSEEVISQHSRKLSTSSSSCDNELVSDLCCGNGDHARGNSHVCDILDPTYKELEAQCRRDYDKRLVEYRDELETVKRDMEKKYRVEIDSLREDYEAKVEDLVRDLSSSHEVDISEMEAKHAKELENLREQLHSAVERVRDDLEATHAKQLGDLKISFEQKLTTDLEALTDRMLSDEADHIEHVKAELIEQHSQKVQQLEAKLAERAEAKEFSEKRSEQLFDLEQKHKRDMMAQLQTLLEEKDQGKFGEDYRRQLEELEQRHRVEMECQQKVLAEQMEQFSALVKRGAEQEQDKFMKVQKEIMSGFVLQHKQDVKLLTEQYEAQISVAQGEIQKLLAERAEYDDFIVQSKRRLHAEVQQDVLQALDEQLQVLLLDGGDSSTCPPELLQLQDKFSARYKAELVALKQELAELRQAKHEPSTWTHDSVTNESQDDTTADGRDQRLNKDKARQLAKTMKSLVCELTKYVSVCEDELNNTLVEQLLKYEAESSSAAEQEPSIFRDAPDSSASLTNGEIPYLSIISNLDNSDLGSKSLSNDNTMNKSCVSDIQLDQSTVNTPAGRKLRRVHFAPDISNIVNMDEESLMDYVEKNSDSATSAIRVELDNCLERLRAEAKALIGVASTLPKQAVDVESSDLKLRLASEVEARQELSARLEELQAYKTECDRLTVLIDKLGAELSSARMRITELESREDVTEGYGEQGQSNLATRIQSLAELQDQARNILNEGRVSAPHANLIEDLCREGDRIVEEAKHEKEDLQLQVSLETPPSIVHRVCCEKVEAADKQLRCTRQFLEEQAAEREQERDDFLQEITRLGEMLKLNENHKVDSHQLSKEVETLEIQVKEATSLLKEAETRKAELEGELKAAIDKVWVLRDIINDLEAQVEVKSRSEASLEEQLQEVQTLLEQQTQSNQELANQLNSGNADMVQHISHLEEQLHLYRQQMEQLQPDSASVQQMTTTLRDFETTLDKKTKELEAVYMSTMSSSSSPSVSEEISVREHIDEMRSATPENASFSLLPLTQLLRLQDKLAVHSRAEQAALKKIQDLEMQIKALRYDEEEVTAERDVLQTQVEEQLLKISLLHSNVEEQRSKADDIIHAASADLQKRLHDREIETRDLKKALENKEKQVKAVQVLLEQTRQAVTAQEAEWTDRIKKEQEAVHKLKKEYKKLKGGRSKKGDTGDQHAEAGGSFGRYIPVPTLIDAVQANCTAEVAQLKQQLEAYQSLNLTAEQRVLLEQLLQRINASMPDCDRSTCESNATSLLFERGSEASRDNDDFYSSEAESDVDESDLKKQLLRKESMIASLRHKLADRMGNSISSLRIEMSSKDKRISQLESQNTDAHACLASLKAELKDVHEQLKNTIAGVAQDKDLARESQTKLMTDIASLEEDLKRERLLTKSLKDELNQLRAELSSLKLAGCTAPCSVALRGDSPSRRISASISAILHKILELGFEALTLEELTAVHEPLCSATCRTMAANPGLQQMPVNSSLQGVDSNQLCSRIYRLEKEIVRKEQASQKKVCSLETSLDYEKQRLRDLKEVLAKHEQSNLEQQSRLNKQGEVEGERDMLRNQSKYHENQAKSAKLKLEREMSNIRRLEEELQVERNKNKHLESLLDDERIRAANANIKESQLLETMRVHLEASRDNESRLKSQMQQMQELNPEPSINESPRRAPCLAPCNTNAYLSHPAAADRHLPADSQEDLVIRLQLELRREQRTVEQMQTLLDKEKQQTMQKIERERDKNKKLRKQLSSVEEEKETVVNELDHVHEAMNSQQLVVANLEHKLADWQLAEQRRIKRWTEEEDRNRKSLEKALSAKFELEQKIMDLEQELLDVRDRAMGAGDNDPMSQLRQQLMVSNDREQQLLEQLAAAPKDNKISTSLLQKLQVMNSILETHVAEHTEIVNKLTLDRQQLRDKVKSLEERAALVPEGNKFAENDMEIVNGILSAERAAWSREKAALLSSLAQAEGVRRHHENSNADADRVRHLFGKYLRVESYRKALVWQKRYLMVVINGYQEFENRTVSQLTHIAKSQSSVKLPAVAPSSSSQAAVNKFRSCGMAVIAIHRMKFLVKRWRHSRSIGNTAVFIHGSTESIASAQSSYFGSRRPVSSYWSVPRGIPPHSASPTREQQGGAGLTSLNRDSHMLKRWQLEPQYRSTETMSGLEPLQVTEYINRFDQLQQRLGLVTHPPT